MSDPLTDKQAKILTFMRDHQRTWGSPPTIREMMAWLGLKSLNGVVCHLKALKAKGFVKKNEKRQCWIAVDNEESEPIRLLRAARREIVFLNITASQGPSKEAIVRDIDAFLDTLKAQEPPHGQPMDFDIRIDEEF